jgi:hypothetical protein
LAHFISYSVNCIESISLIICCGMVGFVGIVSGFAMKGVVEGLKAGAKGGAVVGTIKVISDSLTKGSGDSSNSGSTGQSGNSGQSGGNTGQSGNSGSASK